MKKSNAIILVLLIINFRAHAGALAFATFATFVNPSPTTESTERLLQLNPIALLFQSDSGSFEKFVNNLSPEDKIAIVATKDEALFHSYNEDTDNSPSPNMLKAFAVIENHLQGESKATFSEYTTKQRFEIAFELSSFLAAL